MPTVPQYDNLRAGIEPMSQPRLSSPAAIAGAQIGRFGEALMDAGEGAKRIYLDMQQRANEAQFREIDTNLTQELTALQSDPKEGFDAKRGRSAMDALGDYSERAREILRTAVNANPNPAVRELVNRVGGGRVQAALGSMQRHASTEFRAFELDSSTARAVASLHAGAADWANEEVFGKNLATAVEEARLQGKMRGWEDAQVQGLVQQYTDKAYQLRYAAWNLADPAAALSNFQANSGLISPQVRAQISQQMQQAQKGANLSRAQAFADQLMTRGLPLDEAMRAAEGQFDGEMEHIAKTEIASRYSYVEKARHDRDLRAYGTAQLEVEQRGRVSAATWSQLNDGHRAAILNRQQAEARQRAAEAAGRPVKTDFSLYLDLRQQAIDNPEAFARLDLRQYVDKIGGAQLEQLVDLKAKVGNPKTQRDATTLVQQMNATMQALNIRKPEAKGQFLSYVQAEVDDATQAKGKPLSFDERQQIIDRAVLKGPDPDAWLWGEKRMFQLTPDQRQRFKPNAATDAPATEIDALNEALAAQGLEQTPANRLRLYQRSMSRPQ